MPSPSARPARARLAVIAIMRIGARPARPGPPIGSPPPAAAPSRADHADPARARHRNVLTTRPPRYRPPTPAPVTLRARRQRGAAFGIRARAPLRRRRLRRTSVASVSVTSVSIPASPSSPSITRTVHRADRAGRPSASGLADRLGGLARRGVSPRRRARSPPAACAQTRSRSVLALRADPRPVFFSASPCGRPRPAPAPRARSAPGTIRRAAAPLRRLLDRLDHVDRASPVAGDHLVGVLGRQLAGLAIELGLLDRLEQALLLAEQLLDAAGRLPNQSACRRRGRRRRPCATGSRPSAGPRPSSPAPGARRRGGVTCHR